MYTQQQTHEILVKARNYLEEHGWTTGWNNNKYGDDGPTCLMGSIGKVLGHRLPGDVAVDTYTVIHFCSVLEFGGLGELVEYNDSVLRTDSDIFEKLDKAIAETAPNPADPVPTEAVIETSHDFTL